jgi:hypothetical protein
MSFETQKYQVIRQAFSPDLLEYIQLNCDIFEGCMTYYNPPTQENPYPFGDYQTRNSFCWYGSNHGDALISLLRPKLSEITGKKLIETYSFWRAYYKGSILEKHTDRPSCEFSATICIKKGNTDWPIYFETLEGKEIKIELEPGDLVVYKGDILPHWRDSYEGNRHVQIFVHYIDSEGPYKDTNVYDGRPILGVPGDTKITQIQ